MYQYKEVYILDFTNIQYYLDFHKIIQEELDFPDYYGKNWSAFWDCLTDMVGDPLHIQIIGLDISKDALGIALDNASRLNLFNKAIFRKSDVFSNVKPAESFDIIVSNPPYIPLSEKTKIQKEVSFDPELALYTKDEKGLEFYEKMINEAPKILNQDGYLVFELGYGQSEEVVKLLQDKGFEDIEVIQDLAGIDRVVSARVNK